MQKQVIHSLPVSYHQANESIIDTAVIQLSEGVCRIRFLCKPMLKSSFDVRKDKCTGTERSKLLTHYHKVVLQSLRVNRPHVYAPVLPAETVVFFFADTIISLSLPMHWSQN